jgi:hypothetical protein
MLVKDRSVGLREHAGDMNPVNRYDMFINKCLTFIIASMVVRRDKLGGGPTN